MAALTLTVGFLAYLLYAPTDGPPADAPPKALQPKGVVEVVRPGLLRVRKGGPFDKKLHPAVVRRQTITDPLMTVTGRVAASLRPTDGAGSEERWQFDSPEVLTAHTDWEKAKADVTFAESQLEQVRLLARARIDAQRKVVDRITRLVATGAEAEKDLALEKSTLLEVEVTARKDIHEAESAVRVARREEAATARQLQLAGLDPKLLQSVGSEFDIVMADVPEALLSQVQIGQTCRAVFFGLPGIPFPGTVNSILPVLSKEKRSLRVLLVIDDPDDKLRPGMFAEIGLGTDPREALLAPADRPVAHRPGGIHAPGRRR